MPKKKLYRYVPPPPLPADEIKRRAAQLWKVTEAARSAGVSDPEEKPPALKKKIFDEYVTPRHANKNH